MKADQRVLDANLVRDGSTIEVHNYTARPGRLALFVEEWIRAFTGRRMPGFDVPFCMVDVERNRIIFATRYEHDFDMKNKYYSGADQEFVQHLDSGSTLTVAAVTDIACVPWGSTVDVSGEPRHEGSPSVLDHLAADDSETELKVYNIRPGHWGEYFEVWRKVVDLRQRAGFQVRFAFADEETNTFLWAVGHQGGDWRTNNVGYLSGPERLELNTIGDHIARFELPHVLGVRPQDEALA